MLLFRRGAAAGVSGGEGGVESASGCGCVGEEYRDEFCAHFDVVGVLGSALVGYEGVLEL